MKIKKLFKDQSDFSKLIGTPESLCQRDLDDLTKTLSLALHKEVSDLVSATSYRSHTKEKVDPSPDKILFESVDVIRYAIAIMNAWNISPEKFQKAWESKDKYLSISRNIEKRKWKGEKVAIVDMDDVLCEFRLSFSRWLRDNHKIDTDVESEEYYFIDALEKAGINPEGIFSDFIADDGFLSLDPVAGSRDFMESLRERGYFIQILTARPSSDLRCLYNTFEWLNRYNISFDKVDFASEKLRWCMQSDYWTSGKIDFAIDDSPKHAAEYGKHGIKVFLPRKPYNLEVQLHENITPYSYFKEIELSKEKKNS